MGIMETINSMHLLLVHYNEIALKGKNRRFFEDKLIAALRRGLSGLGWKRVRRLYGRLLVEFHGSIPWESVRGRVSRICGVSHFTRALRTSLDIESIQEGLENCLASVPADRVKSFAIYSKRPNKMFPLNSMELNRIMGQFVKDQTGWAVSLDDPDLPIYLYILEAGAFLAFDRVPGPGGLPSGVSGKVACLISGGIDSPVAAERMMRRGCIIDFIHFHSFPHTSSSSIDKTRKIVEDLVRYRGRSTLYLVPFAELQRKIVAQCPPPYRVLLYRRFMLRTAEAIARRCGAQALVTGESLGQVASQTLENLISIDRAVSIPILRPLMGWDKLEIMREAESIGTYQTSIEPHDDCCGFLMPRKPATHSSPEDLAAAENLLDVDGEVEQLLKSIEVVELGQRQGLRAAESPGES